MTVKYTDEQFIQLWNDCNCSPQAVAGVTGLSIRNVYRRRNSLESKGHTLQTITISGRDSPRSTPVKFERRRLFTVKDGVVIVFTDPHYLPDHDTLAHDALEELIKRHKPVGLICNGDAADGDTISRHDPTRGSYQRFTVVEEMECVRQHFDSLDRVHAAYCPNAFRAWVLGNHDVRLGRYIATRAKEIEGMPYTKLDDWVPNWPLSWMVAINSGTPGMTVLRHRNLPGMLHLQGQKAGAHYIHGHVHKGNVHTLPTFSGLRHSADAGSLADPRSRGFDYCEGNADHMQSFAVLTYENYKLLRPELCYIDDGVAYFRGERVFRKAA